MVRRVGCCVVCGLGGGGGKWCGGYGRGVWRGRGGYEEEGETGGRGVGVDVVGAEVGRCVKE